MSDPNASGTVVAADEQVFETADEQAVDDDGFEVVDETPQLEATVDQEKQAKVDANHPDGIADTSTDRIPGVTLAQEERIRARAAELDRMNARAEFGSQAGRERRTRQVAAEGSRRRRARFNQRAASVNPWAAPERADPRAELSQEQLAAVNRQARRLAEELAGWSRAAIARRLGEAVADGRDVTSAVVRVFETLEMAPGTVIPIGKLEEVDRKEVSIAGRIKTLWNPSHPSIAQVGLIADESGQTRVTIWQKSDAPWIAEGEQVRIHGAARNWYEERVSLAVTGWSTIHFPERDRWWDV
ncbi:DNA-binding protein [Halorubrum ezzemoulense]|uniref:DNA-binding protein n=1 Tax=Halorubrum ezzemoulense TaxID=337243 RepID=A0A256JJ96_HALEZ|nr:DNA-binding protein [Halorubrum ezzemoulense]OYR68841.1 DNA-binding protein [Halorubrum ezzemoulense]